jgi:hypothetical protein
MEGSTLGAIICAAFGGIWGIVGAFGLPQPWRAWVLGLSITVTTILIAAIAMHHMTSQSSTFRGDVYSAAVAFEVVGIIATVWLLRRLGRRQFILPAIGFVVGLHFLGLWRATDLFVFVWTAIGMCVVAVIAASVPDSSIDGVLRRAIAGLGLATVLWTASTFGLK